jgi:uncharacterized protein DUF3995
MQTFQILAIVVAAVLGVDAVIHAYWLTGRVWPARDVEQLSHAVLGTVAPFTPRVLLPLILALSGGATAVLARAGLVDLAGVGVPGRLWAVGTAAVALGLLARGVAGIWWIVRAPRGTWFYRLNAAAYTPACLVLCAATVTVWHA